MWGPSWAMALRGKGERGVVVMVRKIGGMGERREGEREKKGFFFLFLFLFLFSTSLFLHNFPKHKREFCIVMTKKSISNRCRSMNSLTMCLPYILF